MTEEFAEQVSGIGALAEPARRALYLFVAGAPGAVGREEAAEACALPLHTVKFHLDRLVDEGLLEVEFRRLSGRTGPGAGRPAKLYRRSARELSVSLPERRYDLAGEVLAAAIDRSMSGEATLSSAVAAAAAAEGRRVAAGTSAGGSDVDRVAEALTRCGYEPRAGEGAVCLANCPFDALAREHTQLVCGMNLALVDGLLDGLGATTLEAVLDPEPGLCCVKARSVQPPRP